MKSIKLIKSFIENAGYEIRKTASHKAGVHSLYISNFIPFSHELIHLFAADILNFYEQVDPLYSSITKGPLRIAGAWREDLLARRQRQIRAIEERDICAYSDLLANMFRNELVSGMWMYTYFPEYLRERRMPNEFIRDWESLRTVIDRGMAECCQSTAFGNPWGLLNSSTRIPLKPSDVWHSMQAQIVLTLLQAIQSSCPTVLDLGSGYGGTIQKVLRWSSQPIRAILVDIPLNLTSAYAFLRAEFPESQVTLVRSIEECVKTLDKQKHDREIVLIPSLFVETLKNTEIDVLLNAGSLSEMNYDTVEFYLKVLCTEQTRFFVEINSHTATENSAGHIEVSAKDFPIPNTHRLISRSRALNDTRYVSSIYMRI